MKRCYSDQVTSVCITLCHTIDTADLELQPQATGIQEASLSVENNDIADMSENVAYGLGVGLSENLATDQQKIGTSGDGDASVRMVVTDHSTYENFVLREDVGVSPSPSGGMAVAQQAVYASVDDDNATVTLRMVVNDHLTYGSLVKQTSSL